MSMKTILIPTEDNEAMRSALETALQLARRCDSYIEGFALRWDISEFVAGELMGGVVAHTYKDFPQVEQQAHEIFEAFMHERRRFGPPVW